MYELLFSQPPSHQSAPTAFRPAPGAHSYQVAAPSGEVARMVVLSPHELATTGSPARISASASALALAPIRVFSVDRCGEGDAHVQAYGPKGAVVISYDSKWVKAMPPAPPRAASEVQIVVGGLPCETGLLVLDERVAGAVIDDGRSIRGWVHAGVEGVSFQPDDDARAQGPARAVFSGLFVASDGEWKLRCSTGGVVTGPGAQGRGRWVRSGSRVGVAVEVGSVAKRARSTADATPTISATVMSVESQDIVSEEEELTLLLRRP